MPEWDAEAVIDDALVRALLTEQFPELDAASARLLGEGWDNSVWIVEEAWAFRFPRREIAIPGFERELAVLPRLAPLLPAPIPEPRYVGVPSERFRWPFFGAPLLSGREPADAELTDTAREGLGAVIGRQTATERFSRRTAP
jgi:aminoglycoside phosphotransferase (APT) family kinase protein